MGSEALELASKWEEMFPPGTDIKAALADAAVVAQLREIVHPEAEFRFVDSEGGALGDFEVPERGIEGLLAGWADWLQAWDEFRIRFERNLEGGGNQVYSEVELSGRTHAIEISQPGAALTRVEDGRIATMAFYLDRDRARRDAGLD